MKKIIFFLFLSLNLFAYELSTTTVTAKRSILSYTNDVEVLGKDKILHFGDLSKSFLNLPGFSMSKKGGNGSEVFFRGQSASRVPIFLNNNFINGGCGGRMDSGVSYIFPENYEKVVTIKGPQDVRYGSLISGGIILDRDILRLDKTTFKGNTSFLYGSFKQIEKNAKILGGNEFGSLRAIASSYRSDDYKTPKNGKIHSKYKKESISLIATLTPFENSAIEFDTDLSRGFASYADRKMDGRTFDRKSFNLRLNQTFDALNFDFRTWYNEISHIMDNFSYRPLPKTGWMKNPMVTNVKRTNSGFRAETDFSPLQDLRLYAGTSYSYDEHKSRSGMGTTGDLADKMMKSRPFSKNFSAKISSIFTQGEYFGFENVGLFFGGRYDNSNSKIRKGYDWKNPKQDLFSSFARFENYLNDLTFYTGVGFVSRAADFWELNKNNGENLNSEKNTQIDIGAIYKNENFYLNSSAFASRIDEYIFIDYENGLSLQTDALLLGGEMETGYKFYEIFNIYGNLSYTYGKNLKFHKPLPRISPLQANLAFFIDKDPWIVRLDLNANSAQNRIDKDHGNVIGKDIDKTSGFYTLNFYSGYKFKNLSAYLGVDNITDKTYSYHLSKNSVAIDGLDNPVSNTIYEKGRSYWGKIKISF